MTNALTDAAIVEKTIINGDLMCESCIKNAKHSKAGL